MTEGQQYLVTVKDGKMEVEAVKKEPPSAPTTDVWLFLIFMIMFITAMAILLS